MTRAKMKQLLFQRTVNSEEALFQNKINKRWSPALDKIYIYWAKHWAFNPHYLPISIQSRNSVFSCFIVCSRAFSCLCDLPLSPLITSPPTSIIIVVIETSRLRQVLLSPNNVGSASSSQKMSGFLEYLAGCWNSGEEGLLDRSEKRSYIFFAHCAAVKKKSNSISN